MESQILMIGHTRDELQRLSKILSSQGCKVHTSSGGQRAIMSARTHAVDLILLDIAMPGRGGYKLCSRLKANVHTKNIPVIFLSVFNDISNIVRAFDVGGVDYITRPFQDEEVVARVKTHLGLAAAQKRLQAKNVRLQQKNLKHKRSKKALQHAKERAEEANQSKSVFLSNISHELRSPLTTILGFTQVMDRSASLPPEHRENISVIKRSGEHLLALINQVLDLSKIEAGRMVLTEDTVDLYGLLRDVRDMFTLNAETKGLQLLLEQEKALPSFIHADEMKLRQILINLLHNAVKFTSQGSVQLHVSCSGDGEQMSEDRIPELDYCELTFTVKDTGPGISAEDMKRLFDVFEQTESGRQIREGSGLGLSISRKFAQMMGGDIEIVSEVGKGTYFMFHIRVQRCTDTATTRHCSRRKRFLAAGQRDRSGNCFRLLVADDEKMIRQVLVKMLAPLGCDIREAENGQQAIEIWKTWHPHLIWMDMRMPIMNGYDATKQIKQLERNTASDPAAGHTGFPAKIIALTASSFEEERAEILANGCDDYLRKPFKRSDLFDLLHKHLDMKYEEGNVVSSDISSAHDLQHRAHSSVLTPEALALLPSDLTAALRQGVKEANITALLDLVQRIRPHHENVADILTQLLKDFDYETLSQWLNI
ncbi:hybrid sensor histidine kinase/response regulator [candidate division KSB3 bacterium]|uniref:histidine kinase n=1 Tax=candidate division KSB3 bacterium TaxID=2044937 RepID=A0A2G6E338_9BACT|nr:MAG: hybrid sensor histidine kinase/response regulator [candidate division KSB3 bacterium]PIE28693.1 MAG: hybrid sensor histidine kinase/response regulator [candidate division KSB3 bacterium]